MTLTRHIICAVTREQELFRKPREQEFFRKPLWFAKKLLFSSRSKTAGAKAEQSGAEIRDQAEAQGPGGGTNKTDCDIGFSGEDIRVNLNLNP